MFTITSLAKKILILFLLTIQLNAQSLLLFEDDFELGDIQGLELLVLPNRDLWNNSSYGSELVRNGGFDSDSDWTKGAGWTISGGKLNIAAGAQTILQTHQNGVLEPGVIYRLTFEITDEITAGDGVWFSNFNGEVLTPNTTGVGQHTYDIAPQYSGVADDRLYIGIRSTNPFVGSIDNVSVQEITNFNQWTSDNKVVQDYSQGGKQYGSELVANGGFDADSDWDKIGGESEINGGTGRVYSSTGGYNSLQQDDVFEIGKLYYVTFDVVSVTAGQLKVGHSGSTDIATITTSGTYSYYYVAKGTNITFARFLAVTTDIRIDNISVQEITNGSHGLYKNSMELNQTAGLKYYTFDGTDDYISFGTDISLTDNFSISVLFKTTDNTFALVDKYDYGANQRAFQLIISASGYLDFYESDDGINAYQRQIDPSNTYDTGSITFLTLTKSGATLKAYINGVEKVVDFTDATTVPTLHASTAPLLSGARLNSSVPGYFGAMGKGFLAINTGVLTLAQHQQIYYSAEVQSIIAGM